MKMQPFALEEYFSRHEFSTRYTLSSSDCESLSLQELLALADDEAAHLWNNLKLGYTESPGHPLLRKAVSELYTSIQPGHVLVAAPEELIFLAMHALLKKGDEVIATAPAYQSLHEIARSIGCTIQPWELSPTGDGWALDLQFLKDHVSDATKLIVINFPHYPTGHHISIKEQREIVGIARRHSVRIFSDEMYRGAEYRPDDRLPAMTDVYEYGVSLCGLSKSYGLPGLRIGWLASEDKSFLSRCSQMKDYLTICNSAPSEVLGIIAIRSREKILQRTHEIISRNLRMADEFFARHTDVLHWLRPKAGSVAFPKLNTGTPVEDLCKRLMEEKSLLITPGSLFQHPGNHFRIGIGRKSFAEAMAVLESAL